MDKMRGLTLIELMITVAVVAILLALASPSLSDYIENTRIRALAEQFASGAAGGRMEAIKRNTTVGFRLNGTGWQAYLPGNGFEVESVLESLDGSVAHGLVVTGSQPGIQWNGAGRVPDLSSLRIDFTSPKNACAAVGGSARCLRLTVSPGGQVRLCDPALAAPDVRAC